MWKSLAGGQSSCPQRFWPFFHLFLPWGHTLRNNAFSWAPVIKCGAGAWNAKNDFAGPKAAPLSVWARYAQVLFETNEFTFVD